MAIRVVNSDATLLAALGAFVSGDTLQFTWGGPYIARNFSTMSGKAFTFENASSTTLIQLPMVGTSGTCLFMNRASSLGTNNGKGFRIYRSSGTGGELVNVGDGSSAWSRKTVNIYDSVLDGQAGGQIGLTFRTDTWSTTVNAVRSTFTGYNYWNPAVYVSRAGAGIGASVLNADYCTFRGGNVVFFIDDTDVAPTITISRSLIGPGASGLYVYNCAGGVITIKYSKIMGFSVGGIHDVSSNWLGYTLNLYRNIINVTGGVTYVIPSPAKPGSNLIARGNWWNDMRLPVTHTSSNNGYAANSYGAPSGSDFLTGSDPGFTNKAGGDYTSTPSCTLIDRGWATGDATDAAGLPAVRGAGADASPYEFQDVGGGAGIIPGISF